MDAPGRTLAFVRVLRGALGRRLIRVRPHRRYMPPPLPPTSPEGKSPGAPAAAPVARPYIAQAADWPPVQHTLGLEDFALLPESTRALIAALVEPACAQLRAAVIEWLSEAPRHGEPETIVARAIGGRVRELAELIAAVDRYNIAADSAYRIAPRLKLFLVECAIADVAETAFGILRGPLGRSDAIAA